MERIFLGIALALALSGCGSDNGTSADITSSSGTAQSSAASAEPAATITGTPMKSVKADTTYSFEPIVQVTNGAAPAFSIANKPVWADFDTTSGRLTGTPSQNSVGMFPGIVISVSDGTATASLASFSISVVPQNQSADPLISGLPASSAIEGESYTFRPIASSPTGSPLTFSIQNKPSWASFDTSTGELTGTPTIANAGTTANIVVGVSDSTATTFLVPFSIDVTAAPQPGDPVISGTPSPSAVVGTSYSFTPTASSPSDAALTFSIQNKPTWATFNASSGALRGTPTTANVGTTAGIAIKVSDGSASASLPSFSIVVSAPVKAQAQSAVSAVVASTSTTQNSTNSSGQAIKWHPGNYIILDPNGSQADNFAMMDTASKMPNVLGVGYLFPWSAVETSMNNYTTAAIDPYLNKALAANNAGHRNLRFIIQIRDREFNGALVPTFPWYLPAYLNSDTYSGGAVEAQSDTQAGDLTSVAQEWVPAVMDRMIALSAFLASKYDSNPLVEQFDMTGESSIGVSAIPGNTYSYSGYEAQILRFWQATRPQWAHTQIRWGNNYLDSDTENRAMEESAIQYQISVGGPDSAPESRRVFQANRVWAGVGFDMAGGLNAPDERGVGAWVGEVQMFDADWCGGQTCSLSQFQDYNNGTMHNNYMLWDPQTYQGGSAGAATQWPALQNFINAGSTPVYSTACPPSFVNGCQTQ